MLGRFRVHPLWFLFCYSRIKNSILLALTLTFILIASLLEGGSFAFILFGFSVLNGEVPSFVQKIPLFNLDQTQIFSLLMLSAIFMQFFRSIFTYFGQMLTVKLTINLQSDAQNFIYQQIFRMSFSSVNRYKIGDLIHYATAPPTYFRNVTEACNRLVVSAMMILVYIIFMMSLSISLSIFTLAAFGLCAFLQKFFIKKIIKASQSQTSYIVELNKETAQNLSALRMIHLFDRRDFVLKKVKEVLSNITSSSIRLNKWNQLITPLNEMIAIGLVASSMIFGMIFLQGSNGEVLAILLTFLVLAYRLGTRLQVFMSSLGEIVYYLGPIERLSEIFHDKNKEFLDLESKLEVSFEKDIRFDNVSLKYPGKAMYALRNITFEIEKGKSYAFVGASGAGKSSLLDLLLRLYEPSNGTLYVNSKPLLDYSLSSWRDIFGVVSQDVFLFHETIEFNIRFGNLKATENEMIEASKLAGAHNFITRLPDGYQTIVGEKGYKLSGGERQRLSLARALIRNPQILVLDEATSNLDSKSERIIQKALEKLHGKITLLVVAHRLATIHMVDQIIVLDHGCVVERGTHQDLIHLGGRYHHFWSLQANISLSKNSEQNLTTDERILHL